MRYRIGYTPGSRKIFVKLFDDFVPRFAGSMSVASDVSGVFRREAGRAMT